jgi:hypothetical protein
MGSNKKRATEKLKTAKDSITDGVGCNRNLNVCYGSL